MNLEELISKVGLMNYEIRSTDFKEARVDFVRFKRVSEVLKYKAFSEYFIVELSDTLIEKIFSGTNLDDFRDFQRFLLSSTFFSYMNDMRWNIYLIFLIDNKSIRLKNVDLKVIENDDNYARKFFFSFDEVCKFLKRESFFTRVRENSENTYQLDHYQKWVETLYKVELTGCLNTKFQNKYVDDYLEGLGFQDVSIVGNATMAKKRRAVNPFVEQISEIDMGEFRKHCFKRNQKIKPGKITLVHSPNGCGKTSFLEAIELGITNEIKRMRDYGESCSDLPLVKVACKTGNKILWYSSDKATSKCKELDKEWYGVPVGLGKSTLNQSFNRFNYFNSDAPFIFALEESKGGDDDSKRVNYIERFKRLFFDDELIEVEKKWNRYMQEFIARKVTLNKELNECEIKINEIHTTISNLKTTSDFNLDEFNKLLKMSGFKDELISLPEYSDDLLKHTQAVYDTFRTIFPNVSILKENYGYVNPYDFSTVLEKEKSISEEISGLEINLKEENGKKIVLITENKQYESDLEGLKTELSKLERGINYCDTTLEQWNYVKPVIMDTKRVKLFEEYKSRMNELEKKLNVIKSIKRIYPEIEMFMESDVELMKDSEIDGLISELNEKRNDRSKLTKSLQYTKAQSDELNRIKAQIRVLGIEYLNNDNINGVCPLCGADYKSKQSLANTINDNNDFGNEKGSLHDLELLISRLDKKINELESSIKIQEACKRNCNKIIEAANYINNSGFYTIDIAQKYELILNQIKTIQAESAKLVEDIDFLKRNMKLLEDNGITQENINNAKVFEEENKLLIKFRKEDKTDYDTVDTFIIEIRSKLVDEKSKTSENILEIQSKFDLNGVKLASLLDKQIENEIKRLRSELVKLIGIRQAYNGILTYFCIDNSDDLHKWLEIFDSAVSRCEIALIKLKTEQEIGKLNSEHIKIEGIKKKTEDKLSRCATALDAFNKLPDLESSVKEFIYINREKIEYFFKLLHRPKEFKDLSVTEDGIIVVRESDGESVKAHQMSSGQRVSLALSVMFALHLAAENAPRFILFDEPVANMDDLHLLNLIDILREFALQGTQIIFTTANPDVAGIFRRKFSFFEEQFKHFEFIRNNDMPVIIHEITYSPFEEKAVSDKIVV